MTRDSRIALNFSAPPLIYVALHFAYVFLELREGVSLSQVLRCRLLGLPENIWDSFLYGGIPAIIYTWIMDICYRRLWPPQRFRHVIVSTLLGLMIGMMITTVMSVMIRDIFRGSPPIPMEVEIALSTMITALILCSRSRRAEMRRNSEGQN